MGLLLSSHIPKLDSRVPTARVNLIRALLAKLGREYFVSMSTVFGLNYLNWLQSFFVVYFDLGQKTSDSESLEVVRIVDTLVLI